MLVRDRSGGIGSLVGWVDNRAGFAKTSINESSVDEIAQQLVRQLLLLRFRPQIESNQRFTSGSMNDLSSELAPNQLG